MAQTVLEPLETFLPLGPLEWHLRVRRVQCKGSCKQSENPVCFQPPLEAPDLDAMREACALTGPECQGSQPTPPPNAKVKWAGTQS